MRASSRRAYILKDRLEALKTFLSHIGIRPNDLTSALVEEMDEVLGRYVVQLVIMAENIALSEGRGTIKHKDVALALRANCGQDSMPIVCQIGRSKESDSEGNMLFDTIVDALTIHKTRHPTVEMGLMAVDGNVVNGRHSSYTDPMRPILYTMEETNALKIIVTYMAHDPAEYGLRREDFLGQLKTLNIVALAPMIIAKAHTLVRNGRVSTTIIDMAEMVYLQLREHARMDGTNLLLLMVDVVGSVRGWKDLNRSIDILVGEIVSHRRNTKITCEMVGIMAKRVVGEIEYETQILRSENNIPDFAVGSVEGGFTLGRNGCSDGCVRGCIDALMILLSGLYIRYDENLLSSIGSIVVKATEFIGAVTDICSGTEITRGSVVMLRKCRAFLLLLMRVGFNIEAFV